MQDRHQILTLVKEGGEFPEPLSWGFAHPDPNIFELGLFCSLMLRTPSCPPRRPWEALGHSLGFSFVPSFCPGGKFICLPAAGCKGSHHQQANGNVVSSGANVTPGTLEAPEKLSRCSAESNHLSAGFGFLCEPFLETGKLIAATAEGGSRKLHGRR